MLQAKIGLLGIISNGRSRIKEVAELNYTGSP